LIKTVTADGQAELRAVRGLVGRSGESSPETEAAVAEIIRAVQTEGDAAVLRYTKAFDGEAAAAVALSELGREDMKKAYESLNDGLAAALVRAAENIRRYHERQRPSGYEMADENGSVLGQTVRGLERVGIYVPGGRASYPSTVLMNAIPAKVAGVEDIVMVTPPRALKTMRGGRSDAVEMSAAVGAPDAVDASGVAGDVDAASAVDTVAAAETEAVGTMAEVEVFGADLSVLAAAYIAGVDRVILAGGAQAVAAMAYGTEAVPRVDKIVGPGNAYVAAAKRRLYGAVDIDMVAGPSEILVIADGFADPGFVAADMLSQAEHDPSSAAVLLTTDAGLAEAAAEEIEAQLDRLGEIFDGEYAENAATARTSIETNGIIIVCRDEAEMVALANEAAPEHLEILTEDPFSVLPHIRNAGSVFLGAFTPEPVGDYFAGVNHVLPTSGTARYASPLGVYDFVKRMSYTYYSAEALADAERDIVGIGEAEGLAAHVASVKARGKGL
jgi:histidinol dehydrogenase